MKTTATLLAFLLLTLAARAQGPEVVEKWATPPLFTTEASGSDLLFFSGASQGAHLLAALSGLAAQKAVTPEVRAIAASSSTEQRSYLSSVVQLAATRAIALSADLGASARKQLKNLGALAGLKFDKTYILTLQQAQESLQASLEPGASSSDKDIQKLARSGLDTLQHERLRVHKLGF